ncbi:hypothetical protein M0R45_011831 [Rubus argutus]|uniref:Uncharacterized protein n=1 Tax=Rubus argutus TaxID=59490 RepID=A0AAW1YF36_RUBAR
MKGPGGCGEVEVAVSGVVDQSQQDSGPFSPVTSKRGFGIGSMVRDNPSQMLLDVHFITLGTHCMRSSFKGTPPVNL